MISQKTNNADVCGYCCFRFPVTDIKRSVDFYCNVLGYELSNPGETKWPHGEAHIKLKNGNGPSIFLMAVNPEELIPLKFINPRTHWNTSSNREVTAIEMCTNDMMALYERIKQSGANVDKEPEWQADFGYFTFYDWDGNYFRMVEERGVYFDLSQKLKASLGRGLTEHENQLLWGLCEKASTEQQKFLGSVLTEIRG